MLFSFKARQQNKIFNVKTKGFLIVLILTVSLIPLIQIQPANAEPTALVRKWAGYVAGGGEALLTADVLTNVPGEEIFHAGGGPKPMEPGGSVTCLNGRTGVVIWKTGTGGLPAINGIGDTCQPHMVDLDNDGTLELVVGLQSPAGIYILNAEDGTTMFSDTTLGGGRIDSSPVSGDVDGDGYPDLYIAIMGYEEQPTTGKIIHYEYNGANIVERGRVQVWHPCAGGLSLCDTDNDGRTELYMNERDVYFGDGAWGRGTVSFWADTLEARWQLYGWGASSNIPMLADVNKDGIIDIVTTDLSSGVCVLNSTNGHPLTNDEGKQLYATRISGRHNHYQSAIYDIDRDGNLEVLSGDGFEGNFDFVSIFDLWDWTLDARIDTVTAVMDGGLGVGGRSWKGPTVGEVTGDGIMDLLIVTFDHLNNANQGTLQVYNYNDIDNTFELIYLNTGLRHRAIESVVQDVDKNDGGLNEILVLTQGGVIYCFDTPGIASNPRARSEIQFYSESRTGVSEYVPYERPFADISNPSPANEALGVSTSLSSLSFTLDHPLDELMNYVVTSQPNIASATVNGVGNGPKTVTVNGPLTQNTVYHWTVTVTDSSGDVTVKDYSFTTGPFVPNRAPTQNQPTLSGITVLDNLVATPQNTQDADGDEVTNIYNWLKDGNSIASLNLPFATRTDPDDEYSGLATTKDYAFGATGQVFGATWVPDGVVGGAYSFDGNDFIRFHETGTSNRYDGGGTRSEMSIECWVKATVTTSTERLIWKQDYYRDEETGQPISYRLDYRNTGSRLEFTWIVAIGPLGDEGEYTTYTLGPYYLTTGLTDWHQIVVTYKSGVGLRLYVDGQEAINNLNPTLTGNILNTDGPLEIAFRSGSDFAGLLDEVKLYPFAISPDMVYQNYNDVMNGLSSSTISKYDTQVNDQWRCQVTPNDGLTDGATANTPIITIVDAFNTPPVASNLVISPASPLSTDSLVAQYDYFDADGNPEVGSIISWYKNGVLNVSSPILPAGYAAKGEVWYFRVTPSDGFDFGTTTAPSPAVTIQNAPPTFSSVIITPNPALQGDTLTASCYGWFDPDSDSEGYTYQWQKLNGAVWENVGSESSTLSPSYFTQGDTVKVIVTAFDGETLGNTIETQTDIIDSDPPTTGIPALASSSGTNRDDDELTCTAINTQDPDLDSVINIYNWLRGGTSYSSLYMPFETRSATTAIDYSGHENNGEISGATWTEGVIGGAYSFDGNDVITVADSSSLGNDGTWSAMTVEYWVNPSVDQKGGRILSKNGEGAGEEGSYMTGISSSYSLPSNTVFFGVIIGGGYEEAIYQETSSMSTVIPTGSWSHVVGTYKSGVGIRLYINGTLASSLDGVGGNIEASVDEPLIIGYASPIAGTTNRYFKGSLDEIRIYPTALTDAQIFQNYIDQQDGLSDKVTLVPQETLEDQNWRCRVTPNDGWQDGASAQSNQLTIVSGNTRPRIDWYSPVQSALTVNIGDSIDFKQISSDPNGSPLTYSWTLDSVQMATTQNWTFNAEAASTHAVRLTTSDGTSTDYQEWIVNVNEAASQFNLQIEVNGQGTTDPVIGSHKYDLGTPVQVTANAGANYKFDHWLLNGTSFGTSNPCTVTMNANYVLTAVFVENQVQNSFYLAVRGIDNSIYYRKYNTNDNSWETWQLLPGSTKASPAACVFQNQLHLVVLGIDSTLWHGYVNLENNQFSGWQMLSGATPNVPTLATNGTLLTLVAQGLDNAIYLRSYQNNAWNDWHSVTTGLTGDTPAATYIGQNLHLAVKGLGGTGMYDAIVSCNGAIIRNWNLLSGASSSVVTLASEANKEYLLAQGLDNAIYYREYDTANDAWNTWSALPGLTCDTPAATVTNGELQIVVRGIDLTPLWKGSINTTTNNFSGWTLLEGTTPSKPTLTSQS